MQKLRKYPLERVNTYLPEHLQMSYICDQYDNLFSYNEFRIALFINNIKMFYIYVNHGNGLNILHGMTEFVLNSQVIIYVLDVYMRCPKSIDIQHISNIMSYVDTLECIHMCLFRFTHIYSYTDLFEYRKHKKIQQVCDALSSHLDNDVV